jgi:hypothetical protein
MIERRREVSLKKDREAELPWNEATTLSFASSVAGVDAIALFFILLGFL